MLHVFVTNEKIVYNNNDTNLNSEENIVKIGEFLYQAQLVPIQKFHNNAT